MAAWGVRRPATALVRTASVFSLGKAILDLGLRGEALERVRAPRRRGR